MLSLLYKACKKISECCNLSYNFEFFRVGDASWGQHDVSQLSVKKHVLLFTYNVNESLLYLSRQ